ncbi:RNA polymerase sigma factor [Parafilimonas sp.]|uniref:RNA polymerase sigma factor n=1 Tax=Parafilimonas sp. TaxID=1969739 RepID=UPI003F8154FE
MELEATKSKRRLHKLKNSELISKLNVCTNELETNELKTEFYYRFAKYVYKVCVILVNNRGWKQDIAEDIFQETIKKILCNVQKKFHIQKEWNEEVINKKILGWLGRIANNELSNFFKKHHVLDEWDEDINNIEDEIDDEPAQIPISLERAKLQEAYSALKPREQYLIDMCAIHNCLNFNKDEPEKHFLEETIIEICDKLNISRNNLRAIKKRTIEKLLKHLNQIE